MSISKITFSTKLYTSEPLKDGTYPIVLQISWRDTRNKPQVRRKRLGLSCLMQEFDLESDSIRGAVWAAVKKNNELINAKTKAEAIYYNHFENREWNYRKWAELYDEDVQEITMDEFVQSHIRKLLLMDKAATAIYYRENLKALQKFMRKEKIAFREVSKSLLRDFEDNLLARGRKGDRTMRGLKAIFSKAVEQEIIDVKLMPFKTAYNPVGYKFTHLSKIQKKTPRMKWLSPTQVNQILNYKPRHYGEEKALDLWKFSYFTMGVNLKDIALLKMSDIKENRWYFDRAKTQNSSLGKPPLPECWSIINKYYNENNEYIFDFILKDCYDFDDLALNKRKNCVLANLRKQYMKISKELKFDGYFTFQTARFTSATISANRGADMRAVQANMNHSSITTTEIYSLFRNEEAMRRSLELLRV